MTISNDQRKRHAVRRDDRNNDGTPVAYKTEDGAVITWQGDEDCPWVCIKNAPDDPIYVTITGGSDIPGACGLNVSPRSVANQETPAAVTEGDCAPWSYTLEGRGRVVNDLLNAGEDLVNFVLGTVEEPLSVEQHSLQIYSTDEGGYEDAAGTSIKGVSGRLYEVRLGLATAAAIDLWLHVYNTNAASAPAATTPIWRCALPAGALMLSETVRPGGIYCDQGILLAVSTTPLNFTDTSGGEEFFYEVGFK